MSSPLILLTAFAPWLAYHRVNASDELLAALAALPDCPETWHFLPSLPVYVEQAYDRILEVAQALRVNYIICCGMAESRRSLSLEARATLGDRSLQTPLDLDQLQSGLTMTQISQDAGQFVCNGLYYGLLETFRDPQDPKVLFIHVPPINTDNLPDLLADLVNILERLAEYSPSGNQVMP